MGRNRVDLQRVSRQELNKVTHLLYESSHGDTQHIVFIPGTVEECFEFGWRVFDAAERYQTPVFGFSDLDLGMNKWAMRDFEYPD
ncbi:MAG: hypothetical protein CM15mP9_4040 [Methanobacteriota archaeon]|nr:MAG: hypothetical protein CM15mP9_4040 [Euryarchaeota archaeon]